MNFPAYKPGQRIAALTAAAPAAVSLGSPAAFVQAAQDVLFYNPGPYLVHALVGDATAVADTNCVPLPPGALWAYDKGSATHVSLLAVGGAQDVLVFVGRGN